MLKKTNEVIPKSQNLCNIAHAGKMEGSILAHLLGSDMSFRFK
jgi:hypothetical protein